MHRCIKLSRLPKAGRIRALNFRRTTPGTIYPHDSIILKGKAPHVDPTHPASQVPNLRKVVPWVRTRAFALSAIPKAALYAPDTVWPDPPYTPATEYGNARTSQLDGQSGEEGVGEVERRMRKKEGEVVNMSLLKVIPKTVHKSAVIRKKIAGKVKMAMRLIVTRGASSVKGRRGGAIVFSEDDAGRKWVLGNWTYSVIPTLEVYRKPLPELVQEMRDALSKIYNKGKQLETRWQSDNVLRPTGPKQRNGLAVGSRISRDVSSPDSSAATQLSEESSRVDEDSKGTRLRRDMRDSRTSSNKKTQIPSRTRVVSNEEEAEDWIPSKPPEHDPEVHEKAFRVMQALDDITEGRAPPAPRYPTQTILHRGEQQISQTSLEDKRKNPQTGSDSEPSTHSAQPSGPPSQKSGLKIELFNKRPIIVRRPQVNATNAEQGSDNLTSRHGRDSR